MGAAYSLSVFVVVNVGRFRRVYAMNGTSVEIDNTDAEGRLILSGMLFRIALPLDIGDDSFGCLFCRCIVLRLDRIQAQDIA